MIFSTKKEKKAEIGCIILYFFLFTLHTPKIFATIFPKPFIKESRNSLSGTKQIIYKVMNFEL